MYRAEMERHRKMLADFKAKSALPPSMESKTGEPGWIKTMRKHCESYMKDAERLAAEAERFAEFHRMRAEEMRGN
jgi:hypothetical protein